MQSRHRFSFHSEVNDFPSQDDAGLRVAMNNLSDANAMAHRVLGSKLSTFDHTQHIVSSPSPLRMEQNARQLVTSAPVLIPEISESNGHSILSTIPKLDECRRIESIAVLLVSVYYEEQLHRVRVLECERQERYRLLTAFSSGPSIIIGDNLGVFIDHSFLLYDPKLHAPRVVSEQALLCEQRPVVEIPQRHRSEESLTATHQQYTRPITVAPSVPPPANVCASSQALVEERNNLIDMCDAFRELVHDQQATIDRLEGDLAGTNYALETVRGRKSAFVTGADEVIATVSKHLRCGEAHALFMVQQSALGHANLPPIEMTKPNSALHQHMTALKAKSVQLHKQIILAQDSLLVLQGAIV